MEHQVAVSVTALVITIQVVVLAEQEIIVHPELLQVTQEIIAADAPAVVLISQDVYSISHQLKDRQMLADVQMKMHLQGLISHSLSLHAVTNLHAALSLLTHPAEAPVVTAADLLAVAVDALPVVADKETKADH